VAEQDALVQRALGRRPDAIGGHPDVAATDGRSVIYLECKVRDRIKATQVDWIATGLRVGAFAPGEINVVQGVFD
jgi:hypothetical protein